MPENAPQPDPWFYMVSTGSFEYVVK